jgi:hypothetical protein
MILPPFFGVSSKYNEDIIKQIIIDYLSQDNLTYKTPVPSINVTYLQIDGVTYAIVEPKIDVTYLHLDSLHLPQPSKEVSITYHVADVLSYRPPPAVPEITLFIFVLEEDSQIELQWSTPYDNRCDIVDYLVQFSSITDTLFVSTESNDRLSAETDDYLSLEPNINTYNWQNFNTNNNLTVIQNLINNQQYIFRVGAINCVGVGAFGYTSILSPVSIKHTYCNIRLYLSPNSSTDVSASLLDYSCDPKQSSVVAGVSASSQSKFGAGSLYFDGNINNELSPSTYSHIKVNRSTSNWSLLNDFTIELWVKPFNSPNNNQTILSAYTQQKNTGSYNNHFWKLYINNTGIYFRMGINDNSYIELSATNVSLSLTNFTHLSVSRLNNYIRLYINGEQNDRKYYDASIVIEDSYMVIGANQTRSYDISDILNIGRGAVNEPYAGFIDDLMISSAARYAKNFTPIEYDQDKDCDCIPKAPTNLQVFYITD